MRDTASIGFTDVSLPAKGPPGKRPNGPGAHSPMQDRIAESGFISDGLDLFLNHGYAVVVQNGARPLLL